MIRHTSLFVLLLFVSLAVKAAWNGAVASAYAGGDGSKANPYLISNADQLAKLAADVNSGINTFGKYYKLAADIVVYENVMSNSTADLRAGGKYPNFTLIGDYSSETDYKAFKGTFDGDGHVISGIYYHGYVSYMALFRCLDQAKIKNLGIVDSYIFGNANTGGISAYTKDSKIINCYLRDAMVDGHGSYGSGISSHCFGKTSIVNCFVSSTIAIGTSAKGKIWGKNNIAGIAARLSSETQLVNCYNNVALTPTKDNKAGLVNETSSGSLLSHCYYRDNITPITYDNGATLDDVVSYASADFKNGTVLAKLNNNSQNIPGACRWQYIDGSAPVLDYSKMTPELEEIDPAEQASNPMPADKEMHATHEGTLINLSWTAAVDGKTATQKVYVSSNKDNLSSSLVAELGTETSVSVNIDFNTLLTYYWRVDRMTADGKLTEGTVWSFKPTQLAFIGAEGYGRFALGGRGGHVEYVTNLNNSGAGSFRNAATNGSGPRTIVFLVSGIIDLEGKDVITDDYVTIAGQTAPDKGVCFIHGSVGLKNDNICRFIRSARGGGKALPTDPNPSGVDTGGSLGFYYADNSIFDHCTARWGTDETYSSRSSKNITFQRSIISEALGIAGHRNYGAGDNHGYAATIGGDVGSHHHNLLANCYGRNWSMGGGTDANGAYGGRLDIFNNVVYNWGSRTTDGGAHEVNFVGNYYKVGTAMRTSMLMTLQIENNLPGTQSVYVAGNVRDNMDGSLTLDKLNETYNLQIRDGRGSLDWEPFVKEPFFPSYAKIETAQQAYKSVLSDVGANMPVVDDTDKRIVKETLTRTYTYTGSRSGIKGQIDEEADAGGYEVYPETSYDANYDADFDGLPGWWEEIHGTNAQSPVGDFTDANADNDGDGFTGLEDYLDFKANPNYIIAADGNAVVNVSELFKGYTNKPVYTIADADNRLQLTVDGDCITAKPTADNFIGEFTIQVTDGDGDSYQRRVFVAVNTSAAAGIDKIKDDNIQLRMFDIYDMMGKLVYSGVCNPNDTCESLSLGSLSPDVYILKTTDINGKIRSYKVIKR